MKTLAFDQATQKTGYAFFDEENLTEYGFINLTKEKNYDLRMPQMLLEIYALIEKYHPDRVILENVAMQKSAGSLIKVTCILGGVLGYCYEHNYNVEVISPSSWRKALGFKQGSAMRGNLKEQAQHFVRKSFEKELVVTEDEADAICIGAAVLLRDREQNQ